MKIIIIVLAFLALLITVEIIRELKTFKVTHYQIRSAKLKKSVEEKKIVFLSDLHNCVYGKENQKLLRAIAAEKPDLILAAGDMLVGKKGCSTEIAAQFMKRAAKIAPVYYGNGNHEQRMKEDEEYYESAYQNYKKELSEAGIVFLENNSLSLQWNDNRITLSGLEIPLKYYEKFVRHKLSRENMEECIGRPAEDAYRILIAHNPVHAEAYAQWGADLILSGHLHGGIVRIPFSRGVITPQAMLFPKYSGGHYRVGNADLVVSKGLGTHTINIRLFNEAEVVVLHMSGEK